MPDVVPAIARQARPFLRGRTSARSLHEAMFTGRTMTSLPDSLAFDAWIAIEQKEYTGGGGDCVRVVSQPDGLILFFVGDVAGHDARAAELARELDSLVLNLAGGAAPGQLLSILNVTIDARWPSDVFVCAVCFTIDPLTGEGSIAAAGQLPPVVKGASSAFPVDVKGGPPLGVMAVPGYAERPFKLGAGEILVAVTDGVTDPVAAERDLLGISALGDLIDGAPSDPTDVCAALLQAARRAGLRDDATVVAVAPSMRAIAPSVFASLGRPSLAA
jgi:serine phosphatase RsbU (regulator of sigma subunit)